MKKYLTIFSMLVLFYCIAFSIAKPNTILADTKEENQNTKSSTEKTTISPINKTVLGAEQINKKPSTPKASIQTYATGLLDVFPNFPGVTNDYTKPLDSEYSFFPRMNDDSQWYYEGTYATSKEKVKFSKGTIQDKDLNVVPITDAATPGKLRVTDVGRYNGVKLDIIINVTYILKVNDINVIWGTIKTPAKFELGVEKSNFLNLYMSGKTGTEINITITTVESGTENEVKTSGVVTYNQITDWKTLILQKNQIERLFTPSGSIVKYDPSPPITINNGQEAYTFQAATDTDLETNRIVQQYKDLATRAVGIKMLKTTNNVTQILSATPPLIIRPPIPIITGKSTVTKPVDSSAYTIYQAVPSQPSKVLKQFDLAVLLPNVFEDVNIEDVVIKDQSGEVIDSSEFNREITTEADGQQVIRINATDEYLQSNLSDGSGLYSNVFEITVPVKLDFKKDYSAYVIDDPSEGDEGSKLIKVNAAATLFSSDFGGSIGSATSDPVIFTNQSSQIFDFRDENNEQVFQKSVKQTVGTEYDNTNLLDEVNDWGFSLDSVTDNIKGIQPPEDVLIKIILKDKRFDGNINFYKDGQLLENNVLKYEDKLTVSFNTIYKGVFKDFTFKSGQVITFFPKDVFKDEPTNMQLVDDTGKSVGTVDYQPTGDPAGRMVGKINEDVPVGTGIHLKYDATVSNEQPSNSDYKFKFRLLTMDSGFGNQFLKDFTQDVIVKVNTAQLNVNFLDEKGNPLRDPYTSEEPVGTPIDLTKLAEVTDVIKELTNANYNLVKKPDREAITIVDGTNDYTYQFSGTLKISSAPDVLDFETKKATIDAVKYTNPTIIGEPLVISDTRADKVKWSLKARIDQPLTHSDEIQGDIIIPDAIKYKYQDDELPLTDQDTVIFSHQNTDSGSYNVTQERWSKGDGFMLDLQPGAVKVLGKYKAQITITLENAK